MGGSQSLPFWKQLYYSVSDSPMDEIIPGLWLGPLSDATPEKMKLHNIKTIINLSQHEYPAMPGIHCYTLDVADGASVNLRKYFAKTNEIIGNSLKRGEAIYVHCRKGISRSATIVMAYLIYTFGWDPLELLHWIRTIRPCVNPNRGFWKQLKVYAQLQMQKKV
jgi:dual specificity phosphatase 12